MTLDAINEDRLPLLIATLREPSRVNRFDLRQWSLLVREARSRNVLGRVLLWVADILPPKNWPQRVRDVLQGEVNLAEHRRASLTWEAEALVGLMRAIDVKPVFLKGAAYTLQDYSFAKYRSFGDIDLMIPRDQLEQAERVLMAGGWLPTNNNAYDQHYYRTWMHEIPPLKHLHRGTFLDLHHAILPLTARYKPVPAYLFAVACEAKQVSGASVLAPVDMFLHAAAHLFCEGEKENSLRNLVDTHDLFSMLRKTPGYSELALIERASTLDLIPVLALVCRYLHRILLTPGAADLYQLLSDRGEEGGGNTRFHDWIFDSAFLGKSGGGEADGWPAQVRYLRGHFLRMPPGLLFRHLARKGWRELVRSRQKSAAA